MRFVYAPLVLLLVGSASMVRAQITTFSNRTTFDTAVGSTTVEDFTNSDHFPITTGILNSSTNLVVASGTPILPGDILPGVTYSTPIGSGDFFNIDAGGGYTGGFIDSIEDNLALTTTFTGPVTAFGFNTNDLMGNFTVQIDYSGTPYDTSFSGAGFYGFESNNQDITGAIIVATSPGLFSFDLDNFTYTSPAISAPNGTPEPGALGLLAAGVVVGSGLLARRKSLRRLA